MTQKFMPPTRPTLRMFTPYDQAIKGVLLVCACISSLIIALYLLLHI